MGGDESIIRCLYLTSMFIIQQKCVLNYSQNQLLVDCFYTHHDKVLVLRSLFRQTMFYVLRDDDMIFR